MGGVVGFLVVEFIFWVVVCILECVGRVGIGFRGYRCFFCK